MKIFKLLFSVTLCSLMFLSFSYSQWAPKYITQDDADNGTSNQTSSVAVIGEDNFVALVGRYKNYDTLTCNYLCAYMQASYITGRVGTLPNSGTYGSKMVGIYTKWGTGADTVSLWNAYKAVGYPKDKLVFVANNDKDHNILVFELTSTGAVTTKYRMKTGSQRIYALDVDDNGRVYVVTDSNTSVTDPEVKIFDNFTNEPKWGTTHDANPIKTLDLPNSIYRGVAVDGSGKYLFISDYKAKKVVKYVGSPTSGYSLWSGFDFRLTKADSVPGNIPPVYASPINLAYLRPFNILAVSCDTMWLGTGYGRAYSYGRIYMVDPMSGKLAGKVIGDDSVSVIDQAKWNYDNANGSYSNRPNAGGANDCSGYTSTLDVGYDNQGNVYSVSFFGWTVEKWSYFPVLPALTKVRELSGIAKTYELKQNYPNPFNPSTNIEFSVPKESLVKLKIYNILGQEVASLVNEIKQAGNYAVSFNASKLTSGTYFYSLQAGDYTAKKKMMLIK
jgi:hypothetical protein